MEQTLFLVGCERSAILVGVWGEWLPLLRLKQWKIQSISKENWGGRGSLFPGHVPGGNLVKVGFDFPSSTGSGARQARTWIVSLALVGIPPWFANVWTFKAPLRVSGAHQA